MDRRGSEEQNITPKSTGNIFNLRSFGIRETWKQNVRHYEDKEENKTAPNVSWNIKKLTESDAHGKRLETKMQEMLRTSYITQ